MTDPILLLQQVAAQLQQEGKTPSLALFRARLAGQLAPAQLFTAYQQWRANPIVANSIKTNNTEQDTAANTTAVSLNELWQTQQAILTRVEQIEAKLDEILKKLEPI
ncbi:hypothetical protein [Rheinheimera sp. MMS21-TC3]|uniref:hypothetical protein n=1 Tax=Rheinheimera sp. MMS21-TC3 TaxID=3072790 RepID=UPI0028C42125|nr:hypothetical protein [Rheinheimera sp. MMS21-TC3]WNO62020.1 hypothetical protein RDV63_14000 [Rheinheimera sp. MMS21-TC3]